MLRDPPLIGWAEVGFTLNHDSSCRHPAGGRSEGMPPSICAEEGPPTVEYAARNVRIERTSVACEDSLKGARTGLSLTGAH